MGMGMGTGMAMDLDGALPPMAPGHCRVRVTGLVGGMVQAIHA